MSHFLNLQILINSGMAWKLEGSVGRSCMRAIQDGACMLGLEAHTDFYGNRIPARHEIETGCFGTREFVVECYGEDHAAMLDLAPTEADVDILSAVLL